MNKRKKLLNLILSISLAIGSLNVCAEDVVHINKNDPAPFSGFLFTEEKAKQTRLELLELDKTKIQLESATFQLENYKHIRELQNEEIKLYKDQNSRLIKEQAGNDLMKVVWFTLGILVTGGAVYGASLLL